MDYNVFLVILVYIFGVAVGLECWQCVGDECDQDPSLVERAGSKTCRPGESCEKVYFRVKSNKGDVIYESTVRTCSAGKCISRNDFLNCTSDMLENPGCTRRYCCSTDHCNSAETISPVAHHILVLLILTFCGTALQHLPSR